MGKENPHQSLAKPMGAAANFWGEPYAHPSKRFACANPVPIKNRASNFAQFFQE